MADYKLTVGLEIHAELNTRTKMFCDSKNDPDEVRPNTNICPICMGYPGTLPVINKEAVRSILRLGVALRGTLADYTEFDRKNYFYPDIPKGYQISQYKHPLVSGGSINGVALTRIHLEEDTASSSHEGSSHSLVDFNRAGVPLMEMVTEPVMHSADEAMNFAKELQLILQYMGISDANMEKGEMRVEANISVARSDSATLGTKVEVKNINSFRAAGKAIEYEFKRQSEMLDRGEKIIQETRGWDDNRGETFSQRVKEESHDYRYFPDPDLPKLFIKEVPEFAEDVLRASLPELPEEKRERLAAFGITPEHVEIYVTQREWGAYFEEVYQKLSDTNLIRLSSNYITSELKKRIDVEEFIEVIRMISANELSSKGAKEVIKVLSESGGNARKISEEKNLLQINDRNILSQFVDEAWEENKNAPLPFVVGQAIKKSGGRGNPVVIQELVSKKVE